MCTPTEICIVTCYCCYSFCFSVFYTLVLFCLTHACGYCLMSTATPGRYHLAHAPHLLLLPLLQDGAALLMTLLPLLQDGAALLMTLLPLLQDGAALLMTLLLGLPAPTTQPAIMPSTPELQEAEAQVG